MKKESIGNRYVRFMGSWMAGIYIGNFIGKLAALVLIAYILYRAWN